MTKAQEALLLELAEWIKDLHHAEPCEVRIPHSLLEAAKAVVSDYVYGVKKDETA